MTLTPERRIAIQLAHAQLLAGPLKDEALAIAAYEQILETDGAHTEALEALAQLKESSGDADAALSAIEALAKQTLDPKERAQLYLKAAKLLEDRSDHPQALEHYRYAIEADPSNIETSRRLRDAYLACGDIASAVELYRSEAERAAPWRTTSKSPWTAREVGAPRS